ncbi:radical SAM protein [Candidatus Roizmanbacteria bacterium CG10_big_fil_rev_8_21_14_0_10_39_6]|uniref:Radical SAM protein n=1 Tax=Candidatus Roizmanbacteria bacterium CG10_big_fil_rev_8_21_14_0_10_39_6 TaxID=1974853 RepID=A0A2M8KSG5_9BACT|nr:MAG: radical SAM protein [Candidatus Roizmanbacteria bacterium CG10_big_fil_rev_8_21_14_0_10_39_6]
MGSIATYIRCVDYTIPMECKEIHGKTILSKCGIPGIDYVINPYIGCKFGCTYCYASFMGRFVGKTVNDWGQYVYVKINAPELLKKEIRKLPNKGLGKELFLSSVTDQYQASEARYKLTHRCLEVLADLPYEGTVSILTKSPLVLRDIDVLKKIKHAIVGMTITSTDDGISRYFEKFAPKVTDRFKTLVELNKNGIRTYAFIGPLLPHFVAQTDELEKIFQRLSDVGTKQLFVEHLNLSTYIKNRLLLEMKGANRKIVETFYTSQKKEYRKKLDAIVQKLIKKYDMHLLLDMVIFHKEFQKENGSRHPFP